MSAANGAGRPGPAVLAAARALRLREELLLPLGGATGCTWAVGDLVLRLGHPATLRREVLAMNAAAAAVPVPDILNVLEPADSGPSCGALLLSRLPGRPAGDRTGCSVESARRRGEACGRLHQALAAVVPPAGLEDVPGAVSGADAALLHLDLHPFNVLVDESDEVTGVVDWSNAAAGPAVLDRARTWSILTLDPAVLPHVCDPLVAAFVAGWSATARLDDVEAAARAWACRRMLEDLGRRYAGHALDHVRASLDRLTTDR